MEKIIEVDIYSLDDFLEPYNKKMVSRNLIDYIIKCASTIDNTEVKIKINKKIKLSCEEMLREGFNQEYEHYLRINTRDNYLQLIYLVIGVFMLILSRLISKTSIFDEILLIGAWVLIWESISIEMFNDASNRQKRLILKKLAKALIIEKETTDK